MPMKRQRTSLDAWGVLLAGGDGTRLQSLTARIEGDTRPKQFCRVLGSQSLLTQTRRRISPLFAPGKTIAVVTKKHKVFYEKQLNDMRKAALLVQPENHGTGIAIARTILMMHLECDPGAIVAFFPCDHHYDDDEAFLDVVEAGVVSAQENPDSVVLIGAEATYPETDYGWIEPALSSGGRASLMVAPVARIWEKPALAKAQELMRRGSLWNTCVTIGRVSAFIEILCAAAPNAILTMTAGMRAGNIDAFYPVMPVLDFSCNVLAGQTERLLVIRDARSGWADLGTSSRLFATLACQNVTSGWLTSIRDVDIVAAG